VSFEPRGFHTLFGGTTTPGGGVVPASSHLDGPVVEETPFFAWNCGGDNCWPQNPLAPTQTATPADLTYDGADIWTPGTPVIGDMYAGATIQSFATLADIDPQPDFVQISIDFPILDWWGYHVGDNSGANACALDEFGGSTCGPTAWFDPEYRIGSPGSGGFLDLRGLGPLPLTSAPSPLAMPMAKPMENFDNFSYTVAHAQTDGGAGYLLPPAPAYTPDPSTWQGASDAANDAVATLWAWEDFVSVDFSCALGTWFIALDFNDGVSHPLGDFSWQDIIEVSAIPFWRSGEAPSTGDAQVVWVGWNG
jgi:hypothetical protein